MSFSTWAMIGLASGVKVALLKSKINVQNRAAGLVEL